MPIGPGKFGYLNAAPVFLLSTGWFYFAQMRTVSDRMRGLQNNWPNGIYNSSTVPIMVLVTFGLALSITFTIRALREAQKAKKKSRQKPEVKERDYIIEIDFDPGQLKLLRLLRTSNRDVSWHEMLESREQFETYLGTFLKKYSLHYSDPGPVIDSFREIRKLLAWHVWGENTPAPSQDSDQKSTRAGLFASLARPVSYLHGIEEIDSLSRVEISNLSREDGASLLGQVVDKDNKQLWILGLDRKLLVSWQAKDILGIKTIDRDEGDFEFVARLGAIESKTSGLFHVNPDADEKKAAPSAAKETALIEPSTAGP